MALDEGSSEMAWVWRRWNLDGTRYGWWELRLSTIRGIFGVELGRWCPIEC